MLYLFDILMCIVFVSYKRNEYPDAHAASDARRLFTGICVMFGTFTPVYFLLLLFPKIREYFSYFGDGVQFIVVMGFSIVWLYTITYLVEKRYTEQKILLIQSKCGNALSRPVAILIVAVVAIISFFALLKFSIGAVSMLY